MAIAVGLVEGLAPGSRALATANSTICVIRYDEPIGFLAVKPMSSRRAQTTRLTRAKKKGCSKPRNLMPQNAAGSP